MKEVGAHFEFNPSAFVSRDAQVVEVQTDIIALREEYATMDWETNTHEYLGVVEDLHVMLNELQRKIDNTKENFPEATFILEYHKSCALDKNTPFMIYSFGLQARVLENNQERRFNTFIGWTFPPKLDYPEENAIVEQFMANNGIQPYIDDFVSRSPRRCKIDNEDK